MTPEQWTQFMTVLVKIADKRQAITEASDWAMLVAMFSILAIVAMGLLGIMWHDLRSSFGEFKKCAKEEHDDIWTEMDKCKLDCCPKRRVTDV